MATKPGRQGPLNWQVPIVNTKDGTPTPEFIRKWQQQISTNGSIPDLSTAAAVSAVLDVIGTTVGALLVRGSSQWGIFAPSADGRILRDKGPGNSPIWDTISNVLDKISTTRGSLLYRGASGWAARVPVTANNVYVDNGVGADPTSTTLTALLDAVFGNTRGSIIYRGASGWAELVPNTASFVLTDGGVGADPSWQAAGGGGGGYNPGTPPTIVQTAFNTSGLGVTFATAPTSGNLLVSFSFNPNTNSLNAGWTDNVDNTSGTDWGQVTTKTAGASEPTAQKAINTSSTTGGCIMYELHKAAGTPSFVTGGSQAEFSGTSLSPVLFPNVKNCLGISPAGLTSGSYVTGLNAGNQDVLSNTGTRPLFAGHSSLSDIPMVGVLAVLSGSVGSKCCTALFT